MIITPVINPQTFTYTTCNPPMSSPCDADHKPLGGCDRRLGQQGPDKAAPGGPGGEVSGDLCHARGKLEIDVGCEGGQYPAQGTRYIGGKGGSADSDSVGDGGAGGSATKNFIGQRPSTAFGRRRWRRRQYRRLRRRCGRRRANPAGSGVVGPELEPECVRGCLSTSAGGSGASVPDALAPVGPGGGGGGGDPAGAGGSYGDPKSNPDPGGTGGGGGLSSRYRLRCPIRRTRQRANPATGASRSSLPQLG